LIKLFSFAIVLSFMKLPGFLKGNFWLNLNWYLIWGLIVCILSLLYLRCKISSCL